MKIISRETRCHFAKAPHRDDGHRVFGTCENIQDQIHARLVFFRLIESRIVRRLQRLGKPLRPGHIPSGQVIHLLHRDVSRAVVLLFSLVQNDPPDIQFLQGIKRGDVEMVVGIVVGVEEVRAVHDRHFPADLFIPPRLNRRQPILSRGEEG